MTALRQLEEERPQAPLVQIDSTAPARTSLQGALAGDGDGLDTGVEQAFDYRGDVTIDLKRGDRIEGYVFDRDTDAARVRIMPKLEQKKVTVRYSEIERVRFTGRDMADGKNWEAWVMKHAERKAAGEKNIELTPEALD